MDDAPAVVALVTAIHQAEGKYSNLNVEELRRDWREIDLETEAILVEDAGGRLVACADLLNNRNYMRTYVYGFVHPDLEPHLQTELWRSTIQWGERWIRERIQLAPAGTRVTACHFLLSSLGLASAALEQAGYENVRTHYVMEASLERDIPAPVWPQGVQVQTFVPGRDDDAIFTAGEEAFQDLWDRMPSTRDRWLAPSRDPIFDPSLWFWAQDVESGEPAAVCLCSVLGDRGEVDQLGVRRPWRRQGLGLALLHHALAALQSRGITRVALSVDGASPTGAPRLYSRAGFVVQTGYARYVKEMRSPTQP